jgi:hypothetical protein
VALESSSPRAAEARAPVRTHATIAKSEPYISRKGS